MILNGISKDVDKVTANWDGDEAAKLDKLMVVKLSRGTIIYFIEGRFPSRHINRGFALAGALNSTIP